MAGEKLGVFGSAVIGVFALLVITGGRDGSRVPEDPYGHDIERSGRCELIAAGQTIGGILAQHLISESDYEFQEDVKTTVALNGGPTVHPGDLLQIPDNGELHGVYHSDGNTVEC